MEQKLIAFFPFSPSFSGPHAGLSLPGQRPGGYYMRQKMATILTECVPETSRSFH
jgi:hypothetical protein